MDTLNLLENAAACTLSPEELARRKAWIQSEILPHVRHQEMLGSEAAWELEDFPGLAATLERFAELENECCSDLVFTRAPSARPGHLRLEIQRKRSVPRWQRLARLGGLGALATAGVCCGLPLLATALLNGAGAAGLAGARPFWALALAALSAGAGLAWWRRRRASPSCGCDPRAGAS